MAADLSRPSCQGCRFWHPLGDPDNPHDVDREAGECRRHPPTLLHYTETDHKVREPEARFYGVWPETWSDDWCGAFAPPPEMVRTDRKLDSRDLGSGTLRRLKALGVETLRDLSSWSANDLLALHYFGAGSLARTKAILAEVGLRLKGE